MNRTLFAKELRANLVVASIISAVIGVYIVMIVNMFDPQVGESLNLIMKSMPQMFAAFGMAKPTATLFDFMLNYLYGFLFTVLPFVLILIMVNKLIIRPLDRGTMAYLLTTPNSRVCIAFTQIGVLVAVLVGLLVLISALEMGAGQVWFPGALDWTLLAKVNAGLFALWLFFAGLCFLSACAFSNAAAALWAGGGLSILFFLMQMIAQVGQRLDVLKKINPLELFNAYGLAAGEGGALCGAIVLAVTAVMLFAAGVMVFNRRDLCV